MENERNNLRTKQEEFASLMDVKISLEAEIKEYRSILEVEEERLGIQVQEPEKGLQNMEEEEIVLSTPAPSKKKKGKRGSRKKGSSSGNGKRKVRTDDDGASNALGVATSPLETPAKRARIQRDLSESTPGIHIEVLDLRQDAVTIRNTNRKSISLKVSCPCWCIFMCRVLCFAVTYHFCNVSTF